MRNNIDRLKQLLIRTKEYKNRFYKDRDSFFYSKEAEARREDLIKRYEEIKELVIQANNGAVPSISMFGYDGVDVFANSYSSYNSTSAFHCLKVAPEYIIKAIGYFGGKKISRTPSRPKQDGSVYVKKEIVESFRKKRGKFNYGKLFTLLKELNKNFQENNPYSALALIRAILDHIPPLFGTNDFSIVASNYKWGSTDKKYMKQLLNTKAVADDVLHRQISGKQDLISMDAIPNPILINTLLQECLDKKEDDVQLPKVKSKRPTRSKLSISLKKNEISWDNYAEYNGPSFIVNLHIDNYESEIPDFITKVLIEANSNDGLWQTQHFKFAGNKTDEEFKIDARDIKDMQVYLSDGIEEGLRNPRKMPNLDRDTFKLIVITRSKKQISIPIKPLLPG